MSRPFFLTGANAKIIVNNLTMAFATDISYSVEVRHASPRVLGMYEAQEIQPLMYAVRGSFSIIRYIRGQKKISEEMTGAAPDAVHDDGNGIGKWSSSGGGFIENTVGSPFNTGADGRAHQNLDPGKLNHAMMFDIEILQKNEEFNENGDPFCRVARLRNCRITGANFKLGKRTVATQSFTFEAMYMDDDSFIASLSGIGQHLE